MEDKYLYPGADLQPVSTGKDYQEFFLSDVLHFWGLELNPFIEMRYASDQEPAEHSIFRHKLFIAQASATNPTTRRIYLINLAPVAYWSPVTEETAHDRPSDFIIPTLIYKDLRIRYYIGAKVKRPVWVAALLAEVRHGEWLKDEYGHWRRHSETYLSEKISPYGFIEACTELLHGPLLWDATEEFDKHKSVQVAKSSLLYIAE